MRTSVNIKVGFFFLTKQAKHIHSTDTHMDVPAQGSAWPLCSISLSDSNPIEASRGRAEQRRSRKWGKEHQTQQEPTECSISCMSLCAAEALLKEKSAPCIIADVLFCWNQGCLLERDWGSRAMFGTDVFEFSLHHYWQFLI